MSDLKWDKSFAMEQSADDEELLVELLTLLRDSSQSDLEKLQSGMAANDADAVADAAHSIKGAAASLGVEGLRDVAYDIEKKGRANQLDQVDLTDIADLVGQLDSLKA